jgi:hypothetical protein
MRACPTVTNNPCSLPLVRRMVHTTRIILSTHWCWLLMLMMLSLAKRASSVRRTEETRNAQHVNKHRDNSLSYNSQIVSGHVLIWAFFSYFGMWKSCPKFVSTFQLHHVYRASFSIHCIWEMLRMCGYVVDSILLHVRAAVHQLRQDKHQDLRQKRQKLTSASWLRPVCGGFHNLICFSCAHFLRHVADIVSWLLHVLTHSDVRPT